DHSPAGRVGTRLHVWNWEKSPTSRVLDATTSGAYAVTPDGETLATAEGRFIDLGTGAVTAPLWWGAETGLKLRPAWLRFSPDGKTLLAFEHDQKVGTARLIDYPAGTERGRVERLWWAASREAFSADGRTVALFGGDGFLRTYDATGKGLKGFAPPFANTIQSVAVSADGARVMGSYRGNVRVWDAATGKLVCEPDTTDLGLHPEFYAAAFSPDGKQLAAGGGGVRLVLWDANTGKRVRTFPRESMGAAHVRFDAAGTTITTVNGFHGHRTREGADVTVYPTVGTWRVMAE
ncbi:MAG TPA: WD40 repeat domain-containing protein, partial [Urbifossiella sp.]|nr:WD40 repeat domain-containing protein [Urbifossiella sp.]